MPAISDLGVGPQIAQGQWSKGKTSMVPCGGSWRAYRGYLESLANKLCNIVDPDKPKILATRFHITS